MLFIKAWAIIMVQVFFLYTDPTYLVIVFLNTYESIAKCSGKDGALVPSDNL